MRIESVDAIAFGPFSGQQLELSPGLNVVHGPNEAGKSSWHAALYAAICGVRRGGGQRTDDREFAERHKPWDSESWGVSALIRLEDGRRIRVRQDLESRINCSAIDEDLGRDYSAEIIEDGTPNAARWLGFDRRGFRSTAYVRQTEIQAVSEDPAALQDHLQRAAATVSGDATAAAALSALDEYRRENIGSDRANSTKPLRRAAVAAESARSALGIARDTHADYLRRMDRVEELAHQAADAAGARGLLEAAIERREAVAIQEKFSRAQELSAAHPHEPPPELEENTLGEGVATALGAWESRPTVVRREGRSALEIRAEVDRLPTAPDDDVEPRSAIVDAKDSLAGARSVLLAHEGQRSVAPPLVATGGLSPIELLRLADELSLLGPATDAGLDDRLSGALARVNRAGKRRQLVALGAIAFGGLAAAALVGIGAPMLAVLPLILGAIVGVLAVRVWNATEGAVALTELEDTRAEIESQRYAAQVAVQRRDSARAALSARGLVGDASVIRALAETALAGEREREQATVWDARLEVLQIAVDEAETELRNALAARGILVEFGVDEAFAAYERDCRERRAQAEEAAKRSLLERALADRIELERSYELQEATRARAEQLIVDVSASVGVDGGTTEELVIGLRGWQQQSAECGAAREVSRREWYELQALLGEGTLADLATVAQTRQARARDLAQGLDESSVASVTADEDAPARLLDLRERESASSQELANGRGMIVSLQRTLRPVAEAEEELARCDSELTRLRGVDAVLSTTRALLEQAEEQVHRDLAPVLRATVRQWLPSITRGRYVDVIVDPASLDVKVRGADRPFRRASLLSNGTAEQIYLLLRMAMAQHMTLPGEVCPMLLDDVTVQCDSSRREALLLVLHAISEERQVVLFSQEAEVLDWARLTLRSDRDRLIELDAGDVPA